MPDKDDPISILGGGAWGLSTALHLHRQGYTDITVFDRAEQIPSPHSAAFDLNKIVRAEYEDPFYTERALVGPSHLRSCVGEIMKWMVAARGARDKGTRSRTWDCFVKCYSWGAG